MVRDKDQEEHAQLVRWRRRRRGENGQDKAKCVAEEVGLNTERGFGSRNRLSQ
jgi:hypothetical protein